MDRLIARFPVGTKYALVALNDGRRGSSGVGFGLELEDGFVVTDRLPFDLPDHWLDWLGEFRVKEIQEAGLFLSAVAPSEAPEILDHENQTLRTSVGRLYLGFLISVGPVHHREAFTATGAVHEGRIDVRQVTHLSPVFRTAGNPTRKVGPTQFRAATRIAKKMEAWESAGSHPRTRRVFSAFYHGLQSQHVSERLHQFVRVLEGVFKTGRGKGAKHFRSRFSDLAGDGHEPLADLLYEIRGAVEHLRDPYAPITEEPEHEFLGRYTCIAEALARTIVQALYLNERLSDFFKTEEAVDGFWRLTAAERREVWGPPVDVRALSRGFDAADWRRSTGE